MAATNPSYYQSGVCQDIKKKEHCFHLYMNQRGQEAPDGANQIIIKESGLPWRFGTTGVDDWTIRDGPAANANLVARARGMQVSVGKADDDWFYCHSILFTDTRFKGSSLMVLGDYITGKDGEWAIVGGTGEFGYAQGVVTTKEIQHYNATTGRIWELRIRVFSLCISEMKKMGPWGGVGGTAFDIPKPPLSLQTVTVGYGDVVNSIAFSYTDEDGQKKIAGPWGGESALTTTITLAASEVIKQVIGTTDVPIVGGDTIVTSLNLVSNLKTYGPYGKANGTIFSSLVPEGKAVTGFYVRAGASINALGVYFN
ncbi:unnamed protein product [Urochloa decumbens]|uniref:Dirigent protein n=1 Tax=Urochloa decumbens TaxID=240449 RepID=A0ABC9CGI1_9POAL